MSNEWDTLEAPKPKFEDLPDAQTPEWKGETADAVSSTGRMGAILHAFGQGFNDEWGSAQFGPELKKILTDHGVLYNGDGNRTVAKAFNEAFVRPAVNALDVSLRTITGTLKGLGDAAVEAGVPRDVVGMTLENPMFAGGPGNMGRIPRFPGGKPRVTGGVGDAVDLRVAKDLDVIGPPKPPLSEGNAAQAAEAQIRPITAYHGSPYSFDAFTTEKIGSGEGAQSYGHGLYFAEHPEVAKDYAKRLSQVNYPEAAMKDPEMGPVIKAAEDKYDELMSRYSDVANTADIAAIRKARQEINSHAQYMDTLAADAIEKFGHPGNEYQVKLHANKEDFLDWDKPYSEQSPSVKKALDRFGISEASGTGEEIVRGLQAAARKGKLLDRNGVWTSEPERVVSEALHDAGIPGIKYLDQGSRADYNFTVKGKADGWYYQNGVGENEVGPFPSAKAARQSFEDARTHNLVVFDEKTVEITHRNGVPVNKPIPETMPALAADNSLVKKSELSPVDSNPWQERFDEWVTKLQVPEDVKTLIRNASANNGTFEEARAGQIPAEHLGKLSDITGIPVDQLPEAKMRQTMRNDAEFRTAAQLMIKTNDDVFEAARVHSAQPTFESRKELVAALMRRDLALEGVLGLRAEWGRTGNVMQEFLEATKDAQGLGKFIKDKKGEGWNSAKLDEVAKELSGLNSREAQGQFITKLRRPDVLDKAIWYWTNSLLSGVLTHTKYVFANAAYLAHDTFIATPLAGVSGALRRDTERVYMGEAAAKAYGLIAGVPDAIYAAGKAAKTGVPTPLPVQAAGVSRTNPITGLNPIGGVAGNVLGAPSRGISAIHSFYNFLGYRAELEAQGYRQAIKAGHSPLTREFWEAQAAHTAFPDDAAMDAAIKAGERANFVQDLGPSGQKMQSFLYATRLGRFVMPFTKVPGNIFNAVQEGTVLAYLDARMRADLNGKNGGVATDMARGRLAGGAAIMGAAAYWTLQDTITGNGPVDQKERAEWLLTHQPRSVKIGGRWHSYDQFGPIGGWLALSADLTDTQRVLQDALKDKRITAADEARYQKDMTEAYARAVTGFTHWFEEAGFQGLFNMVEAMNDPQKTRASGAGAVAATALPFSSFQSQAASFMDPNLRDTQTFLDGIRNRIPGLREHLPVLRDWSGMPRPNPAYQSVIRNQAVNDNPVDAEMQRLDLKPTKVPNNIKGVRLTPEQYDEYQDHAGIATRLALHGLVTQPGWLNMPANVRTKLIEQQISAARRQADAYMQGKYDNLITEGVDNKVNSLLGQKPVPKAYVRPE